MLLADPLWWPLFDRWWPEKGRQRSWWKLYFFFVAGFVFFLPGVDFCMTFFFTTGYDFRPVVTPDIDMYVWKGMLNRLLLSKSPFPFCWKWDPGRDINWCFEIYLLCTPPWNQQQVHLWKLMVARLSPFLLEGKPIAIGELIVLEYPYNFKPEGPYFLCVFST